MAKYPSAEKVIEYNVLALAIIQAKKADQAKVLSHRKISKVLEDCENLEGDLYDKATILLRGLVQSHPFASGNRRTAFMTMKYFLIINGAKIGAPDDPANARVLQGIREGFYSDLEIKEWIKNGKIREFTR